MADSATILLVEDEPGIQLAIKGLLRREGHAVEVASTGRQAVDELGSGAFDLVLTDLSLPEGLSGLDILRHVKSTHPAIPVILITAYGTEDTAREAVEQGAFAYVPKPFNNDQIRDVVRRALAHGEEIAP